MTPLLSVTKNQNKQLEVTEGLWTTIPTGPWGQLYNTHKWNTQPRLTSKQVRWYDIHITDHHLTIKKNCLTPKETFHSSFINDLHRWSAAVRWAKHTNVALYVNYHNPQENAYKIALYKFQKLPIQDIIDILDGLKILIPNTPFLENVQILLKTKKQTTRQKSQAISKKAQETREKNKTGGNPKRIMEGYIHIPLKPITFQNGTTLTKFYYVKGENDKNPYFYAHHKNGVGYGPRYRATKKYLRRVCPNAFEDINYISAHEKLTLLNEQNKLNTLFQTQQETQ